MKKALCVFLIAAIFLAVCPFSAFAATGVKYYVDSIYGNDSASGTGERSAWKTLARASEQTYSAGDSVLLKAGGVFNGTFTARGSGSEKQPITLGRYGGEELADPLVTTPENVTLLTVHNVSNWVIENIEFTAPEGDGIRITANDCIMKNITVRSCKIHDVWCHQTETYTGAHMAVYISANGVDTRIEGLTLADLDIYDCAYGIHMGGNTVEWSPDIYVSPEVSYSQNFLFENLSLNHILYDGMAICSVNNLLIRNCALINTSLNTDYYTAPLWMHHANRVTVENCEVAGATNYLDGMTVDFDGWTTNSTYQYIYSHDNIRFMQNCVYDNTTKNDNCTVRYCLSVNDNVEPNNVGLCNSSFYPDEDNPKYMSNFKFYNNTIINGSDFKLYHLRDAKIMNNIFYGDLSQRFITEYGNVTEDKERSCFSGVMSNNCFFGNCVPTRAETASIIGNPLFAGNDFECKESFVLSANSPLIGRGVQVEPDMGERDFFGNPLTTLHNVGCYEGSGVNDSQKESAMSVVMTWLKYFIGVLYNAYTTLMFMF